MIKISNCPNTGLERFVTAKDLHFYESQRQVLLECHVSFYKDNEKIENKRIKSYVRTFAATIDTPVDSVTGQKVENFDVEGSISEYDFFKNLKRTPVIQEDFEENLIIKKDKEEKAFDI